MWGSHANYQRAIIHNAYREILELEATKDMSQAIALYLAFALSRMTLRSSEASRWHNKGDKVEAATAGHKLPMLWDYAEVNPFSGGSGSWETTYQ